MLRKRWNKSQPNFNEGDLILSKDSSIVKNQWYRGRLNKILPNKTGKVRCIEIIKPALLFILLKYGNTYTKRKF